MGWKEIQSLKQKASEPKGRNKYSSISKVSEKRKLQIEKDNEIIKLDDDFYAAIWNNREHICYECGCNLGYKFKKWFAHHILPKKSFPEYRHTPENIVLLCLIHHSQAEDDIDKTPKVKALTEQTTKLFIP